MAWGVAVFPWSRVGRWGGICTLTKKRPVNTSSCFQLVTTPRDLRPLTPGFAFHVFQMVNLFAKYVHRCSWNWAPPNPSKSLGSPPFSITHFGCWEFLFPSPPLQAPICTMNVGPGNEIGGSVWGGLEHPQGDQIWSGIERSPFTKLWRNDGEFVGRIFHTWKLPRGIQGVVKLSHVQTTAQTAQTFPPSTILFWALRLECLCVGHMFRTLLALGANSARLSRSDRTNYLLQIQHPCQWWFVVWPVFLKPRWGASYSRVYFSPSRLEVFHSYPFEWFSQPAIETTWYRTGALWACYALVVLGFVKLVRGQWLIPRMNG